MKLHYNNENVNRDTDIHFEEVSENCDSLRPIFNFEPISSKAGDDKISLIKSKETSHDFLKRIEKLSSMTWDEIKKSPKEQYGFEQLSFSSIKGCGWMIKSLKENSIERVMVFRIKNKGVSRMLGARFGKEFRVYCFDDKGKVYNHG